MEMRVTTISTRVPKRKAPGWMRQLDFARNNALLTGIGRVKSYLSRTKTHTIVIVRLVNPGITQISRFLGEALPVCEHR